MEGGSPLSGHAKMTATSGERRRRGGGQGPGLLLADGAGVEAGTAEGAGAEASEETEEVREVAVETGDNQGVNITSLRQRITLTRNIQPLARSLAKNIILYGLTGH